MSSILSVMSRTLVTVLSLLVMTIAAGATYASAQQEIAQQLIGPDSFPELELSEDSVIDFASSAEDPDGEFDDIQGWGRLWRDPAGSGGVVAMAAAMDAEAGRAFLAGFQSTVPPEDRTDHPIYPNVVTLETVNPVDEPTLAAIFSEGTVVFILITEGVDREALLDRAIAAQLDMIEAPLLPQSAGLAEEVGGEASSSATNQFIIQTGLVLAIIFLATWLTRRSLKKRFESDDPE